MILSSTKDPASTQQTTTIFNSNMLNLKQIPPTSLLYKTVQDIIRLEENQLTCQRNFDSTPRQCPTDPYEGWLFILYVRTLQCFWQYRHLSPDLVGNTHPRSRKSQILFHYRCACKDLQLHQVSHIYSCNNLYHCWRILWTLKWRRFLQTFRCRIKLRSKNPTGW